MEKQSLYNITEGLELIEALLEQNEGEIYQEQEISLEQLKEALFKKVDNTVGFVQSLKDDIEIAKKRINDLNLFIKHKQNKIDSIERYTTLCLEKMGAREIRGEICKISLRKPLQVVVITKEDLVPEKYKKRVETVSIDKKKLKDDLKNFQIPGVEMGTGKQSVNFGMK